MLLIPAIDLKEGRCVRLRQGRMDDTTVFSDDPVAMADRWAEAGARRLHIVDLDGAFAGRPENASVIERITTSLPEIPIELGGGIRDLETIRAYLDAGVRYAIIGTQAVKEPSFVTEACDHFPGSIIVGLDAKADRVATDGWAKVSAYKLVDFARRFEHDGVEAIIYTDIGRDGMMNGVNVESTAALADAVSVPIIASGGISNLDDIRALCEVADRGIMGAITGRAIYEGSLDFVEGRRLAEGC